MNAAPGIAYLVGAGPGDPGLMTARALELLVAADVVVHDRLIPDGALDVARPEAELVYVGKEPGRPSTPQERINELLVEHARAGKLVVRLKGGDPFVFGRGGEEAEALAAAGIPVRGGARRVSGGGRARLRRHPRHPPRGGFGGRVRHRARGPRQARDLARLRGARALPGHARLLHGGQVAAPHQRAADRGRARRRQSPPP